MPIKMRIVFTDGWKAEENERYGDVMVVEFFDPANNEVKFRYAPKHSDAVWFAAMFKGLWNYDQALKDMRKWKDSLLELNDVKEGGACPQPSCQ